MKIINFSQFQKNLQEFLKQPYSIESPLIVERNGGDDIVVISRSDYNSLFETLHLLSNANNAQRLSKSLEEFHNKNCSLDSETV